jgi:hypothetical protein
MNLLHPNFCILFSARRITATRFMFVPRCIVLPQGRLVTLRFASPDVIHGILITGTNVNTMVVPGYVAQVHTEFTRTGELLMPCHEYCGLGHSEMWVEMANALWSFAAKKGPKPAFLKDGPTRRFYLWGANATAKLSGNSITDYVKTRFN